MEGHASSSMKDPSRSASVKGSLPNGVEAEEIWKGCEVIQRPRGQVALELLMLRRDVCRFPPVACFDADQCQVPLRIVVDQISGQQIKPSGMLFVTIKAFYGGKPIIPELQTSPSGTGSWMHRVEVCPTLCSLPCETVLMFSLYETAPSDSGKLRKLFMGEEGVTTCIGHGHISLTDECGFLRTGAQKIGLWPGEGSAVHFSLTMPSGAPAMLHLIFPSPPMPVAYSSFPSHYLTNGVPPLVTEGRVMVDVLAPIDPACPNPLATVSQDSLDEAWNHRYDARPDILDWVFQGCNFMDPVQRAEASILCDQRSVWNIPLYVALHLIGFSYSSLHVRTLAMHQLCSMLSNESMKVCLKKKKSDV